MTDYFKDVGSGGTMMIRDLNNGRVEFWAKAHPQTFINQMQWSFESNGYISPIFTYAFKTGGDWQQIGWADCTYSQNVRFSLNGAGTSLGSGWSDFWQWISRGQRPDPPQAPGYIPETLTNTQIEIFFFDGGDGGSPIDQREIWWSDDGTPKWLVGGVSRNLFTGLVPGEDYFFWGKVHNALGWSDLSPASRMVLPRSPGGPTTPTISAVTDNSFHASFRGQWDGGSPVLEWQLGYGTDPGNPQYYVTGGAANSGEVDVGGISAGNAWYVWARGRNQYGWGDWSGRASVRTLGPPDPPTLISVTDVLQSSAKASFSPNGDGGRPILEYQIAYGKTANGPDGYSSTGTELSGTATPLEPGTLYYIWVRARNAYGWGPLSVVKSIKTLPGSWIKVGDEWKQAVPYVNVNGVWKTAQVWGRIAGVWKETG